MRRTLWGAAMIGAVVVTATAAAKTAKPRDLIATRRFIAAETRFDRTELARRGAITTAAKHYLTVVKAGCAGDLAAAAGTGVTPRQSKVIKDLVKEASFDFYAASTRPILGAERALLHSLSRVHFTQLRLVAAVRSIELGNQPDTPGNLCLDIKAAQAAQFAADPPPTAHLLKRVSAQLSGGASTYVPGGLKPYLVTPADRAAYKTLRSLDKRQTAFTDNFVLTEVGRLVKVLV